MIRWWLALAAVAAVALGALAWVGRAAARAETLARATREDVAREEAARLALWRIDALLAPRIARQAAQPYFAWASFYPAGAAYGRMFDAARDEAALAPSPLLATAGAPDEHVLAHVQIGPDGEIASPQVPRGRDRALAIGRRLVDAAAITTREALLARLEPLLAGDALARALSASPDAAPRVSCAVGGVMLENYVTATDADEQVGVEPQRRSSFAGSLSSAKARSVDEFTRRSASYRVAANGAQLESVQMAGERARGGATLELGLMRPVRLGAELLLAREVRLGDRRWLQAAWLDWSALERELLRIARADLPDARLLPDDGAQPEHRLASLPLILDPGVRLATPLPAADDAVGAMLAVAWTAAAIALAVAALLLRGALSLSQRRGAFVSAVTHEMRTPLTTFRLYADLLASDMLVDREQRERCLATLRSEADRLGHLVENVLAYARLERHAPAPEALPAGELVARCRERLAARAGQAGLDIVVDAGGDAAAAVVRADPGAVERVLMNLVDNAAKYAAAAADRRIEVSFASAARSVRVRVRDHGPGVAPDARRRLFAPFAKSSADAARTAPGVGLGLALSRRLLRRQGGDLVLEDGDDGARFALVLPRA